MPPGGLSPRARVVLPALLILLLLLSYWRLQADERARPLFRLDGATMGTSYQVKVVAPGLPDEERSQLARSVEARLEQVNALMSNWRQDSEISRFNAHMSNTPFPLSPETVSVLAHALAVSIATGGAFDVTVAPLVRAWGFGAGAATTPPDAERLAALRAEVGFEQLELDRDAATLRKRNGRVTVDLSAIAKGYGVDTLGALLRERGFDRFLVEIGGELLASGMRPDGTPWRVAIEQPDSEMREVNEVIALHDLGMATSGDYRNFYEQDGARISHTIDPRTGHPVEHALASVTVLHPEVTLADAWATALNVLGPEEGLALAESRGLAAYLLVRTADGFEVRESAAFRRVRAASVTAPAR